MDGVNGCQGNEEGNPAAITAPVQGGEDGQREEVGSRILEGDGAHDGSKGERGAEENEYDDDESTIDVPPRVPDSLALL